MSERRTKDREPPTLREPRATQDVEAGGTEPSRTAVRRFRLAVTAGPDVGRSCTSTGDRVVVGAHESSDFCLHDEAVSRFHCEVELGGERVLLRDLGSHNGTFVDGTSVLAGHLRDGARLRLGRTEMLFQLRDDRIELPLSDRHRFGRLVGTSAAMRRVFSLLEQAAASDVALLIEGETGTGKEIAAESIHAESERRNNAFAVVDCGAIPADLLESELFGHEKGAFTGAVGAREGAFELASGGTIFLDEIGELPLALQPKLLRVLDKGEIKRVGASRYMKVDVRVVAATNRSLRKEVNEKRFRADLYYRLAVLSVRLPPLRDRIEDLGPLTDSILAVLGPRYPGAVQALAMPELTAEIGRHAWPGNVRELRNYLERCLAMRAPLEIAGAADESPAANQTLGHLTDGTLPIKVARERWSREFERRYLESMLQRHGQNVAAAARAAEVDRMHFYRLLWRHGLR